MIEWMSGFFNGFYQNLINVLPHSPFQNFINSIGTIPFLSFLNWFIPVGTFINIGITWLGAIGIFYIYGIVMRWIKLIGD